jgi:hypothetical protein
MSVVFRTLDSDEKKMEVEVPVLVAVKAEAVEIVPVTERAIDLTELKRQITEEMKTEIHAALENYRKSVDTNGDGVISVKEATVEAQRVCKLSCNCTIV